MISASYYINTLSSMFVVLVHCNNSPLIEMSHHAGTLSQFRVNVSLFLTSKRCVEKKYISIL